MVTIVEKSSMMERVDKRGHSYSVGRPPKRMCLAGMVPSFRRRKSTWQSVFVALKSKLEMRREVLTTQDFIHITQKEKMIIFTEWKRNFTLLIRMTH